MMRQRVICITELIYNPPTGLQTEKKVIPGQSYHVVDIKSAGGKMWYILSEHGIDTSFNADAFLVCSDLDETLLINHPIKKRK